MSGAGVFMSSDDFDGRSNWNFWVRFLRVSWICFALIAVALILLAIFVA